MWTKDPHNHLAHNLSDDKARFENVPWHDSKLLGIKVSPEDGEEHCEVEIVCEFQVSHLRQLVIFHQCTIVKMDLDAAGMSLSGKLIFGASCDADPSFKDHIERTQLSREKSPLRKYHHFRIGLIPPGGMIDIFALTFELRSA